MSSSFKFTSSQMRENDPGSTGGTADEIQNRSFDSPGHVRNLCFVWPDGRKKFLNYSYLVSGEYAAGDSEIKLTFTSDTLVIRGSALEGLFDDLTQHITRFIVCTDPRYNALSEGNGPIVNEIIIQKPDE